MDFFEIFLHLLTVKKFRRLKKVVKCVQEEFEILLIWSQNIKGSPDK